MQADKPDFQFPWQQEDFWAQMSIFIIIPPFLAFLPAHLGIRITENAHIAIRKKISRLKETGIIKQIQQNLSKQQPQQKSENISESLLKEQTNFKHVCSYYNLPEKEYYCLVFEQWKIKHRFVMFDHQSTNLFTVRKYVIKEIQKTTNDSQERSLLLFINGRVISDGKQTVQSLYQKYGQKNRVLRITFCNVDTFG